MLPPIERKAVHASFPAANAELVKEGFTRIYDQSVGETSPWYISHCGWGHGGLYLTKTSREDGLDKAETSMPKP